jgi:hypothetical protein
MRARLATAMAAVTLATLPTAASAQSEFFGEDLFGFPSSAGVVSRSLVFPTASAAQALFLAALTGDVGTETFESLLHGTATPVPLTFPGAGLATVTGSGVVHSYGVSGEWRGNDRYPTSGDRFFDVLAGGDFAVQFATPVAAFGFFGVDIGDVAGQLSLEFVAAAGTTTVVVPHTVGSGQSTTGGVIFYGRIDAANPFTEVRFLNDTPGDNFAFDDMTIASVAQVRTAPEPSTLALLATAMAAGGGLAAWRRRAAPAPPHVT